MSKEHAVIAQKSDLENIEGSKAIIAGDVVFATMADESPQHQDFIAQEPRAVSGNVLKAYRKDARKLRIAVDPILVGHKGKRFAFAIDGYLAWGRRTRSKDPVVLFGGAQTAQGINVDVLVFVDGDLQAYAERVLPHMESYTFKTAVQSLIDEFRSQYEHASFHQAEPLSPWDMPEIQWVGRDALRGLRYRRLGMLTTGKGGFALPAAAALAGVMLYAGVVTVGWQRLETAATDYEIAIDNAEIRKLGGINTEYLDLMNTRRMYMEAPRKQVLLAEKAQDIAAGVAQVANVRIVEMHLPAPNPQGGAQIGLNTANPAAGTAPGQEANPQAISGRAPDVLLVISTPKSGETGLDQAEKVMASLAGTTKLSMRLAMGGTREHEGNRIFNIEGFIHE